MRQTSITPSGTLTYPDDIVFANMPQPIELNGTSLEAIVIEVAGVGRFTYRVYNRKAVADIAEMVRAKFGNMRGGEAINPANRSVSVAVKVLNTSLATLFSFTMTAFWGALEPFERTAFFGAYAFDENDQMWHRSVRWFDNFPMSIETIASTGSHYMIAEDGNPYGAPVNISPTKVVSIDPSNELAGVSEFANILVEVVPNDTNVFDATFDFTFTNIIALYQQEIKVYRDNSACGYFLRWIDRQGILQYYLFERGTISEKSSDGESFDVPTIRAGVAYPDIIRTERKAIEKSMKIAALLVPIEEARAVVSIGTASVVDLYVGKSEKGEDLWLPVNVKAGTLSIIEKDRAQDVEVEIELPTAPTQKL